MGLLIGIAILLIARDATKRIWYRLMDAVDPTIVDQIEQHASEVPGIERVDSVRARWIGHVLQAEVSVAVDENNTAAGAAQVTGAVRDVLMRYVHHLEFVTVGLSPPGRFRNQPDRNAPIRTRFCLHAITTHRPKFSAAPICTRFPLAIVALPIPP